MVYTISRGRHRAWPPRLGLFFRKHVRRKTVTFLDGCNYWLDGPDFQDTNKLFGLAFLPGGVHKESARFGWRYDNGQRIVLSAYCYIKGERFIKDLCKVPMFTKITCALYVQKENYVFDVLMDGVPLANEYVPKFHDSAWSFPLGVYFGGNQTAPRNMAIELK